MAYAPQPFVATQSGAAEDAPSGAKPIAIYGFESGEGGVTLPISIKDVEGTNSDGEPQTLEDALQSFTMDVFDMVSEKADTSHTHDLSDINAVWTLENPETGAQNIGSATVMHQRVWGGPVKSLQDYLNGLTWEDDLGRQWFNLNRVASQLPGGEIEETMVDIIAGLTSRIEALENAAE